MAVSEAEAQKIKEDFEVLGPEMVEKMQGKFYSVDGTPMVIVKNVDKTFRKKSLEANLEFELDYVYVGARNEPIFGFKPEGAQEYEFIELVPKMIDEILPMFSPHLAAAFDVLSNNEDLKSVLKRILKSKSDAVKKEAAAAAAEIEVPKVDYKSVTGFGAF